MKPDSSDQAELLLRLRQQLILAQVRIMELEDARDDIATRFDDAEDLRRVAQTIADGKIDEAAHLEGVRSELQHQYEHMRHMQHVTNEALNASRSEFAAIERAYATEKQTTATLSSQIAALKALVNELQARVAGLAETSAERAKRIGALDGELALMKQSRSWRWTAWWRSLERLFDRK